MQTISNTNKYFNTYEKKKKMIVNAVYNSIRIEGSKTSKKNLEAKIGEFIR